VLITDLFSPAAHPAPRQVPQRGPHVVPGRTTEQRRVDLCRHPHPHRRQRDCTSQGEIPVLCWSTPLRVGRYWKQSAFTVVSTLEPRPFCLLLTLAIFLRLLSSLLTPRPGRPNTIRKSLSLSSRRLRRAREKGSYWEKSESWRIAGTITRHFLFSSSFLFLFNFRCFLCASCAN
jgi:hypothetical protein